MTTDPLKRYLELHSQRSLRRERLRNMKDQEILDLSLKVYQKYGWGMLSNTAGYASFLLAACAYLLFTILPALTSTSDDRRFEVQVFEVVSNLAVAAFIVTPVILIALSFSTAICSLVTSDFMQGTELKLEEVAKRSFRLVPRLLVLIFVESALIFTLTLLCFGVLFVSAMLSNDPDTTYVPAFLSLLSVGAVLCLLCGIPAILTRHALTIPIVINEGVTIRKAMKRSATLLSGSAYIKSGYGVMTQVWFVVFLMILALSLGLSAMIQIVGAVDTLRGLGNTIESGPTTEVTIALIPIFLAIWLIVPIWCTTVTVLYFNRRIVWEGYDIDAMAQDLRRQDRDSRFQL